MANAGLRPCTPGLESSSFRLQFSDVVAEGGSQGRDFRLSCAAPPPLGSKSREQEGDGHPLGGFTVVHRMEIHLWARVRCRRNRTVLYILPASCDWPRPD